MATIGTAELSLKRIDTQRATHRAEDDEHTAVLREAEKGAVRVRAEVTAPLTEQAERDRSAYLAIVEAEATASARFGKRKARDAYRGATEQMQAARTHLRQVWEAEPPPTPQALSEWAAQVVARQVENDPVCATSTRPPKLPAPHRPRRPRPSRTAPS
ncbi:hypothetical protein EB836_07125 [Brevibacterium sp. S111]|nr:hypothetical protein EB836_07125 [Brevibacterium sp. S111]